MEKFKRFTDHGTGVNPFVPPRAKRGKASAAAVWGGRLLGSLAALVRVPLAALLLLVVVGAHALLGLLPLPRSLKRVMLRPVDMLLLRLVLLLLGFWRLPIGRGELKRTLRRPGAAGGERDRTGSASHGDVLVCNHSSYLDVLILQCLFSPDYVLVHADEPRAALAAFPAALVAAASPTPAGARPLAAFPLALDEALDAAAGPAVLFVEGTSTNGAGLLRAPPSIEAW